MLRVTLIGNLGGDPEVRYTQKGTQLVSFNVAVNQVRTGPDGERRENTEWFRVKVSGRQSEYVQRFTKGTRVLVIGRLDVSHFKGKDGEARTGFDVWADETTSFTRLEERADDDAPGSTAANGDNRRPSASAPAAASRDSDELEDLPFLLPRHIQEPWLAWRCP